MVKDDTIVLLGALAVGAYLLRDSFSGINTAVEGTGKAISDTASQVPVIVERASSPLIPIQSASQGLSSAIDQDVSAFVQKKAIKTEGQLEVLEVVNQEKLEKALIEASGETDRKQIFQDFFTGVSETAVGFLSNIFNINPIVKEVIQQSSSSGSGSSFKRDKPIVVEGSFTGSGLIPVGTPATKFG